jgi:hypothetical protein
MCCRNSQNGQELPKFAMTESSRLKTASVILRTSSSKEKERVITKWMLDNTTIPLTNQLSSNLSSLLKRT